MSDILTRWTPTPENPVCSCAGNHICAPCELTTELARLTEQCERMRGEASYLTDEVVVPALRSEVERMKAALEFYRDPFAWKKQHDPGNDVQIPDFHSETSFGNTAEVALSHQQVSDRTKP